MTIPQAETLAALEDALGHDFARPELLEEALTHGSSATENPTGPRDYQRLEFLGDSIVSVAVATELFLRAPEAGEGVLSRARSRVVSEGALARAAEDAGLDRWLRLGVGEEAAGGRARAAILADVFEAVTGALYLDAGLDVAARFVVRCLDNAIDEVLARGTLDPKSRLQEELQARFRERPVYDVLAVTGPPHALVHHVRVRFRGEEIGRGSAPSKQAAQKVAAAAALRALTERDWAIREEGSGSRARPARRRATEAEP
jgi:ribonuclease-3